MNARWITGKITTCGAYIPVIVSAAGQQSQFSAQSAAVQAACPAQAISFGDINDSASAVRSWKESLLNYGLLADLNTEPRTTYLAALRNPNPEMPQVKAD